MNNQPTCANDLKHKTKTTINLPLQKILILPAPGMSMPKNKRKTKPKIRQSKNQTAQKKIKSTHLVTGSRSACSQQKKQKKKQPQEYLNNQPTCAKHKTKTTINLPLQKILILPAPRMSMPKNKRKTTTNIRQGGAKNKINKSTYLVTGSLSACSQQKKTKEKTTQE